MAFNQTQQIHQLWEDKKNILITFRKNGAGDAISSAIALLLFLERLGKRVDVICEDFVLPKNFSFLKNSDKIRPAISDLQKFVVTLDVKETGLQELSYDLKDEKLRIYITPKKGFLTRDNVRTAQSDFKYDLIITVNTPDLNSLGGLYENNTELFYKTPIINIDHENANEHYGHINLIDITAASTAEIIYELLKNLGEEYIDNGLSTALLAGMIAATHSFKLPNVKPHTLSIAGKLISLGADRDKIIRQLYRTRSISTLKLWGEALSHLQSDKETKLVWTSITRDNFVRSGAQETDLYDVVEEIISTSPEAELIIIFHEHSAGGEPPLIHVILHSNKNTYDAKKLLQNYHPPTGNKKQSICVISGKPMKQVEEEVVREIKKQL
ncbi:MAG: DHH family phosphoesterase [Patescibacteria group bacterium]